MVARIAVAALVAFRKRRVALEIGAGQVIEQHIKRDIEQVARACGQMREHRRFVLEQPVMAAVELVALGQPGICAQEIGQGGSLEPFAVQSPFAARRQQPIRNQHK